MNYPRSFDHSGFAELIFTCLIRSSALIQKFRHYVTLAQPRVMPARVTVLLCRGETTRPPELSRPPRRVRDSDVNGWLILQRNKLEVTSTRVTIGGEGCLRHPRPCKWLPRRE